MSGCSGAQHLLADRQGPLVVGPGPGQVALGLEQSAQVVQAAGGVGVLGPSTCSRIARARS